MASASAYAAAALLVFTAALLPARADDIVRPPQDTENAYQKPPEHLKENLQDSLHENAQQSPPEHMREVLHGNAHASAHGNARGNGHGTAHANSREGAREIGRLPPHPALRVCLNQKERRVAVEKGAVIHLATALHGVKNRMPGALIRARLCRGHGGRPPLVYVLTVLARDGKVVRFYVDAVKGTVVGER